MILFFGFVLVNCLRNAPRGLTHHYNAEGCTRIIENSPVHPESVPDGVTSCSIRVATWQVRLFEKR